MSGGFGAGFLKGVLVSAFAGVALSLALPLEPLDPKRKTQLDLNTPEGSGFNSERADTNPVLPDTDQAVAEELKEAAPRPEPAAREPQAPVADTASASQPDPGTVENLRPVDPGGEALALMLPDAAPDGAPPAAASPPAPALGLPMPEIDDPVTEVPINRLPIINAPETEVAEPPAPAEEAAPALAGAEATAQAAPAIRADMADSALIRNRVPHVNPAGKPLMAVILIDAGSEGLDFGVLSDFEFPISFALDPTREDAADRARSLREAGFEILALAPADLADAGAGEAPADRLPALLSRLPEAVALIDRPEAALQRNAALSEAVIDTLAQSGHGLLTYDLGLNATDRKALRDGLFAGTVFRVLDGARESGTVIKRYLDRAVLEAGKTGRVIVLGRSYPETVTALFSWALGPKSAAVSLAPVSAVLLAR